MKTNEQLLHFDEERYNQHLNTIRRQGLRLLEASAEMTKLGLPKTPPEKLLNGVFVNKVIEFHKKEWQGNSAFKRVSFEKYQELIELDFTKLHELETDYNAMNEFTFSFYKKNHLFFDYCEHRFPDGLVDAGNKVVVKLKDSFKIKGDEIEVNLSNEYFKLYSTNHEQVKKINEIDQYIDLSRKFNAKYLTVKETLKDWLAELDFNLENHKINYYHLLQNVK